ncbi:MAG TPA: DinB family protein [Vicinamibacterales bacterium]
MDRTTRDALVAKYKAGYQAVVDALAGATGAELDRVPAPGKWTARQIVHHLADSEMTSAIRLRRLLAEDRPLIVGYDQDEFARRLHYDRPIEASLAAFRAARETTAEILDRLTEEDWAREGTHSESGPYGVLTWLEIYAAHAHGHAEQIRRARGLEG